MQAALSFQLLLADAQLPYCHEYPVSPHCAVVRYRCLCPYAELICSDPFCTCVDWVSMWSMTICTVRVCDTHASCMYVLTDHVPFCCNCFSNSAAGCWRQQQAHCLGRQSVSPMTSRALQSSNRHHLNSDGRSKASHPDLAPAFSDAQQTDCVIETR